MTLDEVREILDAVGELEDAYWTYKSMKGSSFVDEDGAKQVLKTTYQFSRSENQVVSSMATAIYWPMLSLLEEATDGHDWCAVLLEEYR